MTDIASRYAYRVQWSPEDGEYAGTVAELPGLSWLAASPVDALVGIQNVASECVTDMERNDERPPEPYADRDYSGRFLVRIPPEEHRRLALEAAEQGVSLNRLASERLAHAG